MDSSGPPRVWISLNAAAGVSTLTYSTDPTAYITHNRNCPIVNNVGDYSLAVARAALQGCRTLPAFLPIIETKQPNPWKTVYGLGASVDIQDGPLINNVWPWDGSTSPLHIVVQTFSPGGVVSFPKSVIVCTIENGFTPANWAAAIQSQFQASGTSLGIPELATLTVTLGYRGILVFAFDADHKDYTLCLDILPDERLDPNFAILPFGFPFFSFAPTPPVPESQDTAFLQTSTGGKLSMPNAPFFGPPSIRTFDEGTFPLIWLPQTAGLPVPSPPLVKQENSPAYYAFDFDFPLTLINNLLAEVFTQMRTKVYNDTGYMMQTRAPVIQFNEATATFSIAADAYSVGSLGRGSLSTGQVYPRKMEAVRIYFNRELSDLFLFSGTRNLDGSTTLNFDQATLMPASQIGLTGGLRSVLTTNFSPVASLWSPVGALVFKASRFNAAPQLTNPPSILGTTDTGLGQPELTSYSSELSLTDVIPYNTAPWGTTDQLYSPTVLHFIQILAQGVSLSVIDFGVQWRHRLTGELFDVLMNPMASISVLYYLRRNDVVDS